MLWVIGIPLVRGGPYTFRGVIFSDGVLLNMYDILFASVGQIVGQEGMIAAELRSQIVGRTEREVAELVVQYYNMTMGVNEFMLERLMWGREFFPQAKLMPGVKDVAGRLANEGIPMAVVTSCSRSVFEEEVIGHDDFYTMYRRMFKGVVAADDVGHAELWPGVLLKAMQLLRIDDPKAVLVVDGSVPGVKGANLVGTPVLFVASRGQDAHAALSGANATADYILTSLAQLELEAFRAANSTLRAVPRQQL